VLLDCRSLGCAQVLPVEFLQLGSLGQQRGESVVCTPGVGRWWLGVGMQATELFHIAAQQIGLVILELQGKSAH
jgi:hypothetical protein